MDKELTVLDGIEVILLFFLLATLIAVAVTWFIAKEFNALAVSLAWLISNLEVILLRRKLTLHDSE